MFIIALHVFDIGRPPLGDDGRPIKIKHAQTDTGQALLWDEIYAPTGIVFMVPALRSFSVILVRVHNEGERQVYNAKMNDCLMCSARWSGVRVQGPQFGWGPPPSSSAL